MGEPKQFLYLAFTLSLEGLEVVSVRQDGGGQEVDACDPLCGSEWEVVLEVVHASGSWLPTGMVVNTESKVALCDPMDCNPPGSSLSTGFSRQEHWSGWPSPSDLPDPGIEPGSPALQADAFTL